MGVYLYTNTYEYSYNFKGKTKSQVTAEGWTDLGSGVTNCGANGLYASTEPGITAKLLSNNSANLKKITITAEQQTSTYFGMTLGICTYVQSSPLTVSNETSFYMDSGANNSSMTITGTVNSINPTYSGNNKKWQYVIDLENKTVALTFLAGGTFSRTISMTDSQINTIRSNPIYLVVLVGSSNYLQTASVKLEE